MYSLPLSLSPLLSQSVLVSSCVRSPGFSLPGTSWPVWRSGCSSALSTSGTRPPPCTRPSREYRTQPIIKLHPHSHTGAQPIINQHPHSNTSAQPIIKLHLHSHTGAQPILNQRLHSNASTQPIIIQYLHSNTDSGPLKHTHTHSNNPTTIDKPLTKEHPQPFQLISETQTLSNLGGWIDNGRSTR